jgi:hypothetical protein
MKQQSVGGHVDPLGNIIPIPCLIGMQIFTVYYFSKWVDYARVMAPFLL